MDYPSIILNDSDEVLNTLVLQIILAQIDMGNIRVYSEYAGNF